MLYIRCFIYLLVIPFVISCNNNVSVTYYDGTKQIKEKRIYLNTNDTTNYDFESYYQNGTLHKKGRVANSKKEGDWTEWYADGVFRRKLTYTQGEYDKFDEHPIPEVIMAKDSLIINKWMPIKIIHMRPSDWFSTINAEIQPPQDRDLYSCELKADGIDSVKVIYYKFSPRDTILFTVEEYVSKYGLNPKDYEGTNHVKFMGERIDTIILATIPVYKR